MIAGKLLIYEKDYEIVCLSLLELAWKIVVRSKEVIFVVHRFLSFYFLHTGTIVSNPCLRGLHSCVGNMSCECTPGESYQCTCPPGYQVVGSDCTGMESTGRIY